MTASRITVAAAFVIAASVPVGIKLSHSRATATPAPSITVPPLTALRKSMRSLATSFDPIQFRSALQHLVDDPPNADSRHLERLIFSLDLDEIRAAIAVIDEFEDPKKFDQLIAVIFSRWAELDPQEAVASAISRPVERWGYSPLNGAWNTWAFDDWDAAYDWVADADDTGTLFWQYFDLMGGFDAEAGIAQAKQIVELLPASGERYLSRTLSAWARHDPEKALAWMDEELTDPLQHDRLISKVLEMHGWEKPQDALSRIDLIDNAGLLRKVRYDIFWSWALVHSGPAADFFVQTGAADQWDSGTIGDAGRAIARNLPARAIEVARGIDDPEKRDSFYSGILNGIKESDYRLVLEAAENVSAEGALADSNLRNFLRRWKADDPLDAQAWVESLPDGPKKESARLEFPSANQSTSKGAE